MRSWMKSAMCFAMGICLVLAGCTGHSLDTGDTPEPGDSGGNTPMGRYVEQTAELPEGDMPPRIMQSGGSLILYNLIAGAVASYESADGRDWTETSGGIAEALAAYAGEQGFGSLECTTPGPDGDLYMLYKDEAYLPHIIKYDSTKALEEVTIEGWDAADDGSSPSPEWLDVLDGGDLLVGYIDRIVRYSPDGTEKMSFDGTGTSFAVYGNQIMNCNLAGDAVVISDLDSGEVLNTVPYPSEGAGLAVNTDVGNLMAADDTGVLYIVDNEGIHRLTPGGSLWETVVDGETTSLGMPSINIIALLLDGRGGFYVEFGNNASYSLAHYTFSSETAAVPDGTLSIYALQDNETVRQAISVFQRMHPDFKVDFRSGLSGDSAASVTDLIRTLNTELLAGKGPDVLMLDGLPIQSYIEKGVLMDMSGALNPLVESGDILSNIAAPYVQDGKIYAMPTRVAVPVMIGSDETVGSLSSLKALADAVAQSGDAGYLPGNTSKGRVAEFFITSCPAWINADGTIEEEALADFLTDIKRIGDVTGDRQYTPQTIPDDAFPPDELGYIDDGMPGLLNDYARGNTRLSLQMLTGFMDLMFPVSVKNQVGGKIAPLCGQSGNVFAPRGIAGVNNASPEQDIALDFVKILLGDEVQATDLSDGFPVNAAALEQGIQTQQEGFSFGIGGTGQGAEFVAEWPSPQDMQKVGDMIKSLDTPSTVDPVLLEMIEDGSEAFFAGEETAAQAAHAIAQRTQAYLTE